MLKQRLLTAVVLIALILVTLFFLPPVAFSLLLGLFVLAASWEWSRLAGLRPIAQRVMYVIFIGALGSVTLFAIEYDPSLILPLTIAAFLWWCYVFTELLLRDQRNKGVFGSIIGKLTSGCLVLVPAWPASVYLLQHEQGGPGLVLFLLALVGLADSAAFFTGRAWGKTKLAPQTSPGKTVEGLLGGLVAVAIFSAFFGSIAWGYPTGQLLIFLTITVIVAVFAAVGDLTESKLKRVAGVKDSGSLLPGHGGVLDRIDAFTAAAPVFTLGWVFMLRVWP